MDIKINPSKESIQHNYINSTKNSSSFGTFLIDQASHDRIESSNKTSQRFSINKVQEEQLLKENTDLKMEIQRLKNVIIKFVPVQNL